MKKYIKFLILYLITFSSFTYAEEYMFDKFVGENLHYKITWFGIYAGDAYISINKKKLNNKDIYEFKGIVKSARWFSSVYYVKDEVISIVDAKTLKPMKISIDYREGKKFKRKEDYIFDYSNNTLTSSNKKRGVKELPKDFIEMFSAFYTIRTFNYSKTNKELKKLIADGRKFYKANAIFYGHKIVSYNKENKKCMIICPEQVELDLFGLKQDPDALKVYITDDAKKIPLKAEGKIRIGALIASLKKIHFN